MQRLELAEVDMFKESIVSKETLKQYQIHVKFYLEHNPPAIISDNGEELTNFIIKYLTAMKKRGYSYSYRSSVKAAIKHYYKSQRKKPVIDWETINSTMGEKIESHPVGPTPEQVRLLVDLASVKKKMIILTAISTGIRREALCQMKLEDMTYIPEYKLYKFRVYPGTEHQYVTFCTPEAAEAIKTYLAQEKPKKYLLPSEDGKGYMDGAGLSGKLRGLMIKAGLGKKQKGKRHDKIPSMHGFKHFCITQMTKAKIDFAMKCIMTDQQGELGVSQRYTHNMDDALLQEYLKAIPKLTIYEKFQPVVINESDKDKQIAELKSQVLTLAQAFKEVNAKMNSLGDFVNTKAIHLSDEELELVKEFRKKTKE